MKNLHSKIGNMRLLWARKTGSSTKYSSSFSEREIAGLSLQVFLRATFTDYNVLRKVFLEICFQIGQ